jgi:hypothetical protein
MVALALSASSMILMTLSSSPWVCRFSLGTPDQPNHSSDLVPPPRRCYPVTCHAEGTTRLRVAAAGIGLEHCAVTGDGVRRALEYDWPCLVLVVPVPTDRAHPQLPTEGQVWCP